MGKVVLYYSEHCASCLEVIEYLAKNRIQAKLVNVTRDQAKFDEMLLLGGIATPFILIGNRVVHSFDRERMETLLEGCK